MRTNNFKIAKWAAVFVTATVVGVGIGCVKRTERITVSADGGVRIHVDLESKSLEEFTNGDASPTTSMGWKITHRTDSKKSAGPNEVPKKDEKEYHLIADRAFAPGEELPDSFADPAKTEVELHTRFPTELIVEERRDATYYHFKRTYKARGFKQIPVLRKSLLNDEDDSFSDENIEALTDEQLMNAISAFADFEAAKILVFARAAFLDVTPSASQDAWLVAHRDATTLLHDLDLRKLADMLRKGSNDEQAMAELAVEGEQFETDAVRAIKEALRGSGQYSAAQIDEFTKRYDRHKHYDEITDDLEDEDFDITVEMPGEIVATNARKVDGSAVSWAFPSEMFRFSDFELMVTSRVPR